MRAVAKVLPQSSHVFGFGGLPIFFFAMPLLYKRCVGNASTLYKLFLQVAPQREAGRHSAPHLCFRPNCSTRLNKAARMGGMGLWICGTGTITLGARILPSHHSVAS
jgi:hypothetical protein